MVLQHFKMRRKLVKKLTYIHQHESLSESQGINSANSWLIEYFVVLWPYNFVTSEVLIMVSSATRTSSIYFYYKTKVINKYDFKC